MLRSLSINNIVLIESLDISFGPGFTVMTGETGAGKSILLGSLSLVLGERAEARMLRPGAAQGSVTAEFEIEKNTSLKALLDEHGIMPEEGRIRLKRVIYSDNRSRAFVNDEAAGVNLLKKIAALLVEIHGQHEHTLLLDTGLHRVFLDRFGGYKKELAEVRDFYQSWQEAENSLNEARAELAKSAAEEDYLRHIYKELDSLDPKAGEEEELAAKRNLLMNSGKIAGSLDSALLEITRDKNVSEALRAAQRFLYHSKFAETNFAEAVQALEKAATETDEAIAILEKLAEGLESDPALLDKTEERLFALKAAARKYNRPVSELSVYRDEVLAKLQFIEGGVKNIRGLEKNAVETRQAYIGAAEILKEKREKAARKMEQALAVELKPLKMASCVFKVEFKELPEAEWNAHGREKITFLVETNPGSGFQPISKIASGGELSRFMLALRVVLQETKSAPTMIFDEVDSGIGGAVADSVGARLAKLSGKIQVLAVTHQPQVAAYAGEHLLIVKEKKAGQLKTSVRPLAAKERKEELARMLAGATITDEARAAAHALMEAR